MDPRAPKLLARTPVLVNVGVGTFADGLTQAGFDVINVEWSPPAADDAEMAALLDDLL